MRVRYSRSWTELRFKFEPESGDGEAPDGTRLAAPFTRFELGTSSEVHPDLLAVAAFLTGGPFASKRLMFPVGISERLAHALRIARPDCAFGPVDRALWPRSRPTNGRPGLAFSGGVDSVAALEVMPNTTEPVFVRRLSPEVEVARYPKSADGGLAVCEQVAALVRHVTVVPSDLEYARDPVGFPDHMSPAVPIVLLADALNIDSVGWGTIGEAAYRYGSGCYQDFSSRKVYTQYSALFSAIGLPFCNPVIGVSEVGTAEIVRHSRLAGYAQSCMRGGVEPCGACKKCFRKTLLSSALTGEWPSDAELDRLFSEPHVLSGLKKNPIKLRNVYTFFTSRYDGRHPKLLALKRLVGGDTARVDWMTRYIPSSLDLLPSEYRVGVTRSLERFVRPMSPQDTLDLLAWRNAPVDGAEHAAFVRLLQARTSAAG